MKRDLKLLASTVRNQAKKVKIKTKMNKMKKIIKIRAEVNKRKCSQKEIMQSKSCFKKKTNNIDNIQLE